MRVDRQAFAHMVDGTRIALTLYLPEGDGPFPAVLESLPYRKDDDCFTRDWMTYRYLAERGIAGVRLDIRGTGGSEGLIEDEYSAREMADAVEVIAWVAEQEWCNGNVGMWGISWGGFSALQTAMLRPPALKAIAAMHATHDRFATDVHYLGGSIQASEQGDWPASMIALNGLPPDPEIVGEGWRELWLDRLENTPQWIPNWFHHQCRDAYWLHGSPCADYSLIQVPTLLIGGWLDGYIDGMLALLEKLECPRRTIIGPWGHRRPASGVPAPTYDHFQLLARWFGHHLRGDKNGVMDEPFLTVWIRSEPPFDAPVSTGHWLIADSWPGRRAWDMNLGAGPVRSWNGPQWIGSHAPAWDRTVTGSTDPSADDAFSLTFDSEPLTADIDILGSPKLDLLVASDQSQGVVAARLLAVSPEGDAHLICRGSRNLKFPDDLSQPVPVEPGMWRRVAFPLLATSARVPAGWKVRLALAGADFPIVWPPGERFTLSIDPGRSRLRLPLLGAEGHVVEIPPAPASPQAPSEMLTDESSWAVDRRQGRAMFRRHSVSRELQDGKLTYSSDHEWQVEVGDDDPGSTALFARVELGLERSGWSVGTTGRLRITADRDWFHVDIDLEAREGEHLVFERSWEERIARVHA